MVPSAHVLALVWGEWRPKEVNPNHHYFTWEVSPPKDKFKNWEKPCSIVNTKFSLRCGRDGGVGRGMASQPELESTVIPVRVFSCHIYSDVRRVSVPSIYDCKCVTICLWHFHWHSELKQLFLRLAKESKQAMTPSQSLETTTDDLWCKQLVIHISRHQWIICSGFPTWEQAWCSAQKTFPPCPFVIIVLFCFPRGGYPLHTS